MVSHLWLWLRALFTFREYAHRRQVLNKFHLLPRIKEGDRMRTKARQHAKCREVAKVIQLHQKDRAS